MQLKTKSWACVGFSGAGLTALALNSARQRAPCRGCCDAAVCVTKRGRRGELVHVDVKWWAAYLTAAAGAPTVTQTCQIESVSKAMDSTTCIQSFTTRLAYSDSELLPVEKGTTCAPFLHCAAGYFRDHGITHIERVMTDNAWAYRLPIAPSVRRAGRPPGVHQTALQLAERKGRTPQPHPANRVGLPTGLHQ